MKNLKSFLKKIDGFGVPYLFKYKSKENYKTSFGGLVILIFSIFVISFSIYYFIPFANMKNYTLINYTINIPNTEPIDLKKSKLPFSLGLICENNNNINMLNVFELEAKFIKINKNPKQYNKNIVNITTHNCISEDFNYEHSDEFIKFNLYNYKCLDKNDFIIEGTNSDEIYSYYEFILKYNSESNNMINFLQENKCGFQIVYTDININFNNYNHPVKTYLNSLYLNLIPSMLMVQNIYFMHQYLHDDDNLFGVYGEDNSNSEIYTSFSRYEQYSLLNQEINNNKNNEMNLAKIYLRADKRKTYIKRKYQKFIEFYADISSIFISIYSILMIILNYFNNFYAEFSLSKKIFLFKDVNNENIDFNKKILKIQQLISLTNQFSTDKNDAEEYQDLKEEKKNDNIIPDIDDLEIEKIKNELLKNFTKSDNYSIKTNNDLCKKRNKKKTVNKNNFKFNRNSNYNIRKKIDSGEVNKNYYLKKEMKTYDINYQSKFKSINLNKEINSNNYNSSDRSSETRKDEFSVIKKNKLINYNYNLLDILKNLFFRCYIPNELKKKNDLNNKANQILFNKMDIVVYIRTMLIFDIICQILFNEHKKYVVNLLCRPVISSKEVNENELNDFYKLYDNTEFVKSTLGIQNLLKIENKNNSDNELITLCNKQLKDII